MKLPPTAPSASPFAPEGWPVHAPGLRMAFVDRVLVVQLDAALTAASFAKYREEWLRSVDARTPESRVGAFYSIPAWAGITAAMRKEWGAMLKSREEILRVTTVGMALATPSLLVRGAVSAVFWLAPPKYPHAVVERAQEGFAFLATKLPRLDAAACVARYEELVRR